MRTTTQVSGIGSLSLLFLSEAYNFICLYISTTICRMHQMRPHILFYMYGLTARDIYSNTISECTYTCTQFHNQNNVNILYPCSSQFKLLKYEIFLDQGFSVYFVPSPCGWDGGGDIIMSWKLIFSLNIL